MTSVSKGETFLKRREYIRIVPKFKTSSFSVKYLRMQKYGKIFYMCPFSYKYGVNLEKIINFHRSAFKTTFLRKSLMKSLKREHTFMCAGNKCNYSCSYKEKPKHKNSADMRRWATFAGLIFGGCGDPPPTYSLGYSQSILIPRCRGNGSPDPAFIRLISLSHQLGEIIVPKRFH